MKWLVKISLVVIVVGLAGSSFAGTYSGGGGTEGEPYQIGSAEDIIEMSNEPNDWDDHFLMIADVNMVDYTFTTAVIAPDIYNTEYHFQGIPFTGVFDGAEHNILNLTIDTDGPDNDYVGLFGQISGEQAQVKNLGLAKVTVIGGDTSSCLGGLCGRNFGTISNCYSTGMVSGHSHDVGGLCGVNWSTIINCYSEVSVSGGDYYSDCLGGMCGSNYGTITNCYATGSVTGGTDSMHLGGLCRVNRSTIINCYSKGSVSGGADYSIRIGGLCGINYDTISNCYATGIVSGYSDVGGLCGMNYSFSTISNCYATGSVSGGWSVGGLCGDLSIHGTISNSFWDIETSGVDWSDGGTGLTTAQMQMQITFTDASWDFIDIWNIGENQTYPYLRIVPGSDINKDRITDLFDLAILSSHWLEEN